MFHELYVWLTVHSMLEVKITMKKIIFILFNFHESYKRSSYHDRPLAGLTEVDYIPPPTPSLSLFRIYGLHRNLR